MNEINPGILALNDKLAEELVSKSQDLMIDYLQLAITDIFEDHVLSEIPVVKTIAAACKTGLAIRDRHFAKKLLVFLSEFHKGEYDESNRQSFISDMNDPHYRNKVVETVTIYLDRYTDLTKSIMLSRLLVSYINGKFDWLKFDFFSNCLDLLFVHDVNVLKALHLDTEKSINEQSEIVQENKGTLNRLAHLGFIHIETYQSFVAGRAPVHAKYNISSDGIKFYESISSLSL